MRCRTLAALPALSALFFSILVLRVLDKTGDHFGHRSSSPGNSISNLWAHRLERDKTHTWGGQPADMLRKNGDAESRGNILDTGARPIHLLHYPGRETRSAKQTG